MDRQNWRFYAAITLLLLVCLVGGVAGFLVGGSVGTTFLLLAGVVGLTGVIFLVGTPRLASGLLVLLGVVATWLAIDSYIDRRSLDVLLVLFISLALVAFWRGSQRYHTAE